MLAVELNAVCKPCQNVIWDNAYISLKPDGQHWMEMERSTHIRQEDTSNTM